MGNLVVGVQGLIPFTTLFIFLSCLLCHGIAYGCSACAGQDCWLLVVVLCAKKIKMCSVWWKRNAQIVGMLEKQIYNKNNKERMVAVLRCWKRKQKT